MIKAKTIGIVLMAYSPGAMIPSRTPSNGLDTANRKQTSQPEVGVVELAFILFSQAFEQRNFATEIFLRWLGRRSGDLCDTELFSANHPRPEIYRD